MLHKKAYQLTFISQINRDGSGTTPVSKDYLKMMRTNKLAKDDVFELRTLSLSQRTFIAHGFNSFVVRLNGRNHPREIQPFGVLKEKPKRVKTLNVSPVTKIDVEKIWETKLPYKWPENLYITCNSKGEINWHKGSIYQQSEIDAKQNVKILTPQN